VDLDLSEAQRRVQHLARTVAREEIEPQARRIDREERFPAEIYRRLGELGLLGVNVPQALGGQGAGPVAYALAMIEIASACASTSVGMAVTNMCAELITAFGSDAQRARYVRRLVSGEAVAGSFALSEPHAGSDAGAVRTTAARRGERWVLNGTKQWITSGAHAQVIVVWARTSDDGSRGLSCFIVEGGTRGLEVGRAEDKMGLRASNTVSLVFEDCELDAANLLGRQGDGFKLAMAALDGGRIGIAAQACGVGRAALDASVFHARGRQAFGGPIADLQAIQFMLADMQTRLEAARLLTLRAAWLKEGGRQFTREAAMAKLFASETSNWLCDRAVQIHGGCGTVDSLPVERYFRDARVQTIYEGTSEIQRLVIAREVLRELGER
jgi:alkylation response protein AidB-like acyl-CoA dehydrogenase